MNFKTLEKVYTPALIKSLLPNRLDGIASKAYFQENGKLVFNLQYSNHLKNVNL
jgi:hypothetical protein